MNTIMEDAQVTEYKSLITCMRDCNGFTRTAGFITTFLFLFSFYSPGVWATIEAVKKEFTVQVRIEGETGAEKLSNALQQFKDKTREHKQKIAKRMDDEGGFVQDALNLIGLSLLTTEDTDELNALNAEIQNLHQSALKDFDEMEANLKAKQLPQEILQRHAKAVARYQAEYQAMQMKLQQLNNAKSLHDQEDAAEKLDAFMHKQQFKKSHQFTDPSNLPFGVPDPGKTRKPIEDQKQLNALIKGEPEIRLLADTLLNSIITSAQAQTKGFIAPIAADLAETIDVQFTDGIKAKALELEYNPVKIYNWVRNNIEFLPTYGSIQGADITLQTLRGNPFDTASLLMAILRASGIHARYAYGVVQIPADQVMNWVGGVEVSEAAISLLGQGGIPNTGITQSGKITHIKLEHIWVEAWIDYEPSRGAKHKQGDSWIPMDASFKQYIYSEGVDIKEQVPFDARPLPTPLSTML